MVTLAQIESDPIFRALDPRDKEFMQERRLSAKLNPTPFDMSALIPFGVFPHIKSIPTVGMMLADHRAGRYKGKHTIVVDSSGNTAHAVCRLAPAFGFKHVKVVMSTDVPDSKRDIMAALSWVEIIQVPTGVAKRAREEGARPGHVHLDQYKHLANMETHCEATGPEIQRVLGDNIGVVAIAMGSGGTAAGIGKYFRLLNPKPVIVGVRPLLGEQVPGTRDENRMKEVVTLPWERYVDCVVEVSRKESFIAMRRLWSEVEPMPGPSSGLAYAGLLKYLNDPDTPTGMFQLDRCKMAFICPDDGRFYTERTMGELDPDQGIA